ncbi:MAG: hypothetical protein ACUVR4_02980 [Anaerolineae bacterium]
MTTAPGNTPSPGSARGRGLDALFDSTAPPPGPKFDVEADLAALLDNEVLAAETGRSTDADAGAPHDFGADSQPQPTAAGPSAAAGRTTDSIDVPPLASEAQPAPSAAEPGRQLPTTKRFGAIIMDEVPQPAGGTEGTTAEALVPAMPGERTLPSAPGATAEEEKPLPVTERTEDQKTIVISRLNQVLDPDWQRAFHQQIDALYKQVATEFSSPPAAAERALTLLREARQLMIDSPEEYVNAEYRLMQVRAMVDRVKESRKQSVYYGPRILAYETAWLLVLLLGLIFATPLTRWLTVISGVSGPALLNINPILNTMFWGGIGGVVGALYALWWHISERQNFDRNYLMWYLVQPLMGLVLGGITFLILTGGFLILQVDLSDDKASTGARLLPYLTAVLAGFRQNFVYEQLDRLISLFTPSTRRESGGEGPSV